MLTAFLTSETFSRTTAIFYCDVLHWRAPPHLAIILSSTFDSCFSLQCLLAPLRVFWCHQVSQRFSGLCLGGSVIPGRELLTFAVFAPWHMAFYATFGTVHVNCCSGQSGLFPASLSVCESSVLMGFRVTMGLSPNPSAFLLGYPFPSTDPSCVYPARLT